ncbi:MAG: PAS domain-containing protein [Gammaproteobacteria bacterium]|nr:PAS domain-containing protein [Gammaproteobacteria bacterium]MBU1723820.1 PAS domain-containing protein [Gammaproteobacteria bacterium]MBU2007013.1 PAS domain-containing protein [Gammaproteobacteria bacterium]
MSSSKAVAEQHSGKGVSSVVVGIGASAGGLEALKQLFRIMPDDTGVSFVLIQHLDPNHTSLLAEQLANFTPMPVSQVNEATPAEPNHVYVIPPNKYLFIENAVLKLSDPVERRGMRMAVDFFFRSLGEDRQGKAIGIILSGTGSDGSQGIKAIKEHGGMVMAQSPASAQYDGMPRNAIHTGVVDEILDVEDMPAKLVNYIRHPYIKQAAATQDEEADYLQTVLGILRARANYDFHCYKKGTLTRRIQRRMGLKQIEQPADYITYLRATPDEVTLLSRDLLIGVTSFFRDEAAFKALEENVVEWLVREAGSDDVLRIWVPGCASGEEAYSIGILFLERLRAQGGGTKLQIFATDLDEEALETARNGVYPESIATDMTPQRLEHFFIKLGDGYQVIKPLREAIVFATQNVVRDAPFSKLDLISCRNLLIYLKPEIQKKLFALFHFALKPDGYLFLGGSETVGQQSGLFGTVNKKWRIYQRIGSQHPGGVEFPIQSEEGRSIALRPGTPAPTHASLAQQALLEEFAPAAVLVNRHDQILYYYGSTGEYLSQPTGEPTHNLIYMARDGLRTKLRAAVLKARRENMRTTATVVSLRREGGHSHIDIHVSPVKTSAKLDSGLLLVAFMPHELATAAGVAESDVDEGVVRQLEAELAGTREDLQSTIEELESSNEELKASNEEIMSMNEELQSTNEELETSKEELQSVNEELNTVNNQLQDKVSELAAANDDLTNLFSSTDLATLFLDTRFRIKRFTPSTTRLLKLIPSDAGRCVEDIATLVRAPCLRDDVGRVLDKLEAIEREVQTQDERWFLQRITPYRTEDNRIDGVVVTWVDINPLKLAQLELVQANRTLEERVAKRTRIHELLKDVAKIANHADSVAPAFAAAIERLCIFLGWPAGHAYLLTDKEHRLVHAGVWSAEAHRRYQSLISATEELELGAESHIIGQVSTGRRICWLNEPDFAANCSRYQILKALDLKTLVAFPVIAGDEALATIELFTHELLAEDPELLDVLSQVGVELGRVAERVRTQNLLTESEERFRYMSDNTAAFVWLYDSEGNPEWFNQHWLDFTGWTQAEGRQNDWTQLLHPDDKTGFLRLLEESLPARQPFEIEWRLQGQDGEYHWLLGKGVPRSTPTSRFLGYIFTCIDITTRKKAEEAARQQLTELAHLGRVAVAGEMAAGLAHEINQPLAAIANYAKGMRRLLEHGAVEPDKLIPVLDKLSAQSNRAGEIIHRLRAFIQGGKPTKTLADINQLIHDAAQMWNPQARLVGVDIQYKLDETLPKIAVDVIQIQQVLLNLVRNAMDAMSGSKGQPQELVVQTRQNQDGNIEIIVMDSGIGMSEQELDKLFQPFFTTKPHGMGLGNSISRTIIEAHGGSLSAYPNPERGMSFLIILPVAGMDEEEIAS